MMAQAERIYILMVKVKRCFPFSSSMFSKIENMFFRILLSYRNTNGSLGELKKLWKHSPAACVPTEFLVLPNFHLCFPLDRHSTLFLKCNTNPSMGKVLDILT